MKAKENMKIVPSYTYHGCGFPVTIIDAPMKKFRDDWYLDIDASLIDEKVAFVIAAQPARMTGKQVEFIRKWNAMPMRDLAKILGVSHVAIHKWEKAGKKATAMDLNTERMLRVHIFMKLGFSSQKTLEIVTALNAKHAGKTETLQMNADELKSA